MRFAAIRRWKHRKSRRSPRAWELTSLLQSAGRVIGPVTQRLSSPWRPEMASNTSDRRTTRRKKNGPRKSRKKRQKFLVKLSTDGRGRKTLVELYGQDGNLLTTDRADLSEEQERRRLVSRTEF